MATKTNICCLNVDNEVADFLQDDHCVYVGSIGCRINLSYVDRRGSYFLLPLLDLPQNLQEYDIFVIDLKEPPLKEYEEAEHRRKEIEGKDNWCFYCSSPQTVFNSIPFGSNILNNTIKHQKRKKSPIYIIFQESILSQTYQMANWDEVSGTYQTRGEKSFKNYDFAKVFLSQNCTGTQIKLEPARCAKVLFEGLVSKCEYRQTFYTPNIYDKETGQYVPDPNFVPLLLNHTDDVVSYIYVGSTSDEEIEPTIIMLPQMDANSKVEVIRRLFSEVLYPHFSEYFPFIEEKKWIHNADYAFPEVLQLREQQQLLKKQYEEKVQELDMQEKLIIQEKGFLHDMLTATGADLVRAVVKYFKWLGWSTAASQDEREEQLLQEDIQVDLGEQGLLIVEVKGIQGTSRDSECAQIEKIKHRREKERHSWDVKALYVVNHQRHIEPKKRINPPFTEAQITDAQNAERGLVSTWQLFNAYKDIENGKITKEFVRNQLLQYGLITLNSEK